MSSPIPFDQSAFDIRSEWGEHGVALLAPAVDAVIIVDVLSFSTAVEVATSQGARVYPYRHGDEGARSFADSLGAELSGSRGRSRYSLSPRSLAAIPAGTKLVLPSPNGSALSLGTRKTPTLAGCLRNARAVAEAALRFGRRVAVIPAGEGWPDGRLRPAYEDLVGAGAVISHLPGTRSPEAEAAAAAFEASRDALVDLLQACGSGRELALRGFAEDVACAAQLDVSTCAPQLVDGAYANSAARM